MQDAINLGERPREYRWSKSQGTLDGFLEIEREELHIVAVCGNSTDKDNKKYSPSIEGLIRLLKILFPHRDIILLIINIFA